MKKNKRFSIFTVVVSILFANASLGQGIYSNSVIQTNYPTSKCGHNERKNKNELNIISLNSVNAVNNPLLIAKFSILFPLAIDMRWTGNGVGFPFLVHIKSIIFHLILCVQPIGLSVAEA
jgi:hypothetical protein